MTTKQKSKIGFYVELPSDILYRFKAYCKLYGKKGNKTLEEILRNFLQSVGMLEREDNPEDEDVLEQLKNKIKNMEIVEEEENGEEKIEKEEKKYLKILKEKERLERWLRKRKTYDKMIQLAMQNGLRFDANGIVDVSSIKPTIANMLKFKGPESEDVRLFISLLRLIEKERRQEVKLNLYLTK
ncbi:MAG: hypothetical protein QXU81_00140 [Candidatus Bathyarchaeia archaeon]